MVLHYHAARVSLMLYVSNFNCLLCDVTCGCH